VDDKDKAHYRMLWYGLVMASARGDVSEFAWSEKYERKYKYDSSRRSEGRACTLAPVRTGRRTGRKRLNYI